MDHIPQPESDPRFRDRAYPIVPLLCSPIQYGGRSRGYKYFRAFPARLGIRLADFLEPPGSAGIDVKNIQSKLPALQAWLFFGLLTEVFGEIEVPVDLNDFVKTQTQSGSNPPSSKVISTTCLEKYLYCWMAAWTHWRGTRTVLTRYARNLDRCLELHSKLVSSIGRLVVSSEQGSSSLQSETYAVLLSLAVLGEALQEAYQVIGHPVGPQTQDKTFGWQIPALDQALTEAGWCPGEITTELRNFNTTYLLYLSMIDRHGLDQDHSTCEPNQRCRANQVNFGRYETEHVPNCTRTNCSYMGLSIAEEVGEILCDGDIPVITLEKPNTKLGAYTLQVSRSSKHDKSANGYVAISHVWSEGLGNRQQNTLPLCQLERLQSLVNNIHLRTAGGNRGQNNNNVPFWIDTISVPLVSKWKTLAIASMDRVYTGARGVLVLDKSLQRSWSDVSDTEQLVRLGHSAWRTRLWTYQEGRLAHTLWIQFQDRAVDMRSLQSQERYLKAVAVLNREASYDKIASHPNLAQLARALALEDEAYLLAIEHDACLPKQDDPKMEDLRRLAMEIRDRVEQERKRCGPWRSRMASEWDTQGPSGDDMRLKTKLFNSTFDTVVRQAQQVRNSTLGRWADAPAFELQTLLSESQTVPGQERMAVQLVDTCHGLRGRRTSRVEDESICLSVLLGLDVRPILQVPVLPWRVKDALVCLKSLLNFDFHIRFGSLNFNLGASVRGYIDKILRDAHERRMKIWYSQVGLLPYDVIFWNTPRLHGSGWRWAPASFLATDLEMTGPASCHCRIAKDGAGLVIPSKHQSLAILTLTIPAPARSPSPQLLGATKGPGCGIQPLDTLKDTSCPFQRHDTPKAVTASVNKDNIIQLHFPVPVMEFFLRWKDARLRLKRALPEGHRLWQDLCNSKRHPTRRDDVVILVARHAPARTPAGRLGVLCLKYKEDAEADLTYLHYMALIERCDADSKGEHVGGGEGVTAVAVPVLEVKFHSMRGSLCID